ncbi:hypothetical protein F5Y16DRAFT_366077 [Xylariaceae sp. FL0255]|nr:hypothetical protein F5Y16DRAFT_366077 [Xylariaceae sp. FL0255]
MYVIIVCCFTISSCLHITISLAPLAVTGISQEETKTTLDVGISQRTTHLRHCLAFSPQDKKNKSKRHVSEL